SDKPMDGLLLCQKLEILKYIIPELEKGIGVEQGGTHAYDVWTHLLKTVQHSADKKYPLHIRLAALLHDISKPESRRKGEHKEWTFYGHEVIGSRVTRKILERLKFSRETIDRVVGLVRWHMFFSDTETITHSAVRRLIANVGKENVWDLINIRLCDRIGTGRPKENPYRLRKYQAMVEEVMEDPVSLSMLKINGQKIIEILGIPSGPRVGFLLHALFEEVIDNPVLNTEDYLTKRTIELNGMSDSELKKIGEKGKKTKENEEIKRVKRIRSKHYVE
ncbi:MAG: HD domain-containing protein, partial [Patescibacteria group bacterium]